ncbi:hypothetical protein JOB18_004497 [Solea senegalensis]|uniref:Uncharacterized protein n=1 Tax=Solea senegalensis TaxID=28829 RepID=A0AAV6Q8X4_SOLSE|nr:hypothetical protein JOB18_004497 [Solea senegalensis]
MGRVEESLRRHLVFRRQSSLNDLAYRSQSDGVFFVMCGHKCHRSVSSRFRRGGKKEALIYFCYFFSQIMGLLSRRKHNVTETELRRGTVDRGRRDDPVTIRCELAREGATHLSHVIGVHVAREDQQTLRRCSWSRLEGEFPGGSSPSLTQSMNNEMHGINK